MKNFEHYGFLERKEECSFKTGTIDEIHVDIYCNGKYMLLARMIEKNVEFTIENGRAIFRDKNKKVIMNLIINSIESLMEKCYDDQRKEFSFSLNGVCYRMVVLGAKTTSVCSQ